MFGRGGWSRTTARGFKARCLGPLGYTPCLYRIWIPSIRFCRRAISSSSCLMLSDIVGWRENSSKIRRVRCLPTSSIFSVRSWSRSAGIVPRSLAIESLRAQVVDELGTCHEADECTDRDTEECLKGEGEGIVGTPVLRG